MYSLISVDLVPSVGGGAEQVVRVKLQHSATFRLFTTTFHVTRQFPLADTPQELSDFIVHNFEEFEWTPTEMKFVTEFHGKKMVLTGTMHPFQEEMMDLRTVMDQVASLRADIRRIEATACVQLSRNCILPLNVRSLTISSQEVNGYDITYESHWEKLQSLPYVEDIVIHNHPLPPIILLKEMTSVKRLTLYTSSPEASVPVSMLPQKNIEELIIHSPSLTTFSGNVSCFPRLRTLDLSACPNLLETERCTLEQICKRKKIFFR